MFQLSRSLIEFGLFVCLLAYFGTDLTMQQTTCCVAQASLSLTYPIPPLSECWDYKRVSPHSPWCLSFMCTVLSLASTRTWPCLPAPSAWMCSLLYQWKLALLWVQLSSYWAGKLWSPSHQVLFQVCLQLKCLYSHLIVQLSLTVFLCLA